MCIHSDITFSHVLSREKHHRINLCGLIFLICMFSAYIVLIRRVFIEDFFLIVFNLFEIQTIRILIELP